MGHLRTNARLPPVSPWCRSLRAEEEEEEEGEGEGLTGQTGERARQDDTAATGGSLQPAHSPLPHTCSLCGIPALPAAFDTGTFLPCCCCCLCLGTHSGGRRSSAPPSPLFLQGRQRGTRRPGGPVPPHPLLSHTWLVIFKAPLAAAGESGVATASAEAGPGPDLVRSAAAS